MTAVGPNSELTFWALMSAFTGCGMAACAVRMPTPSCLPLPHQTITSFRSCRSYRSPCAPSAPNMDPKPNPEYPITIAPSSAAATAQRVVAELSAASPRNHFTIPSPTPPFRSQLYSAHSGCARAEPRNDSGESADAFRPWELPTHGVSEQRVHGASLSHGEASCFHPLDPPG
jgi:hypothetical protein